MTLFVLDSSVAVKWVLPEPGSAKALAFQDSQDSGLGWANGGSITSSFSDESSVITVKISLKKGADAGEIVLKKFICSSLMELVEKLVHSPGLGSLLF